VTDSAVAERLAALALLADKLRVPSHRLTAEQCMEAQDEVRAGLRRLYKDLTGTELPREGHGGHTVQSLGQAGRCRPVVLVRDRARTRV